jgi:ABC-type Fe3+/spermidine/putrescine transport system ATPase subunit
MRYELVRIFKQLEMTVIYVTHNQMGIPETLHNEPVSEYAAKFMGSANIIRNQGNATQHFIRPEEVQLPGIVHPNKTNDHISFNEQIVIGKVVFCFYQGYKYRYFVKVPKYENPIEVTFK